MSFGSENNIRGISFPQNSQTQALKPVSDPAAPPTSSTGSVSFLDFLDIINPLQHIPLVGSLYRTITGDDIATPAKVAGGALFGGPLGAMLAMVSDIGSALFENGIPTNAPATQLAYNPESPLAQHVSRLV